MPSRPSRIPETFWDQLSPEAQRVSSQAIPTPSLSGTERDLLFAEYNHRMNEYISNLGSNSDIRATAWSHDEEVITDLMLRLQFFDDIASDVRGISALRINDTYDSNNLSHRFLVIYLSRFIRFSNILAMINQRPQRDFYINIPRRRFISGDLNFLVVDYSDGTSPTPSDTFRTADLRITAADESIDFAVNGQKLKLSIQVMSNRESRSRYISAINLHITSERNTNVRQLFRLEKYDTGLVFRRLDFNRPLHGFKFARRPSGRLIVKEIS